VIYLDTSAAMKLVREEAFSGDLSRWLAAQRGATILSSVLIEVELIRATRRSAPEQLGRASEVLAGIATVKLVDPVVGRAAGFQESDLRSHDAIHLATAHYVESTAAEALEWFVAYDERLRSAARQKGLTCVAPGVS
jgi:predicted nucleic acid-binding protein